MDTRNQLTARTTSRSNGTHELLSECIQYLVSSARYSTAAAMIMAAHQSAKPPVISTDDPTVSAGTGHTLFF